LNAPVAATEAAVTFFLRSEVGYGPEGFVAGVEDNGRADVIASASLAMSVALSVARARRGGFFR
jgi:hypothetical protein